jgi:hypothetical protein
MERIETADPFFREPDSQCKANHNSIQDATDKLSVYSTNSLDIYLLWN